MKKGNDTIAVQDVVAADATNKIFYVNFFSKLEYGTYDLTIKDVKDRTALGNTLVEYKGTFVANDTANPMISSVDYNNSNRKLTLNFGREMDLADLQTRANYFVAFKKSGYADPQNIAIPAEVTVNPVNGGKSVVLQFPEYIDGTRVTFGPGGSVTRVWTTGLKSKTGQYVSLDNQVLTESGASLKWIGAKQKDAKTFEVTFNHVIANASKGDFLVNGQYPSDVSINDGVVTLKTSSEVNGGDITIFANNSIETYSNNKLNLTTNATMPVNNAAAPRVVKVDETRVNGTVSGAVYNSFVVTFSVDVEAADYANVKNDIILKNLGKTNSPVINKGDYTVEKVSDRSIRVDIYDQEALSKPVRFQVADNASYLYAKGSSPRVYVTKSDEYQIAPPAQSTDSVAVTGTKVTVADKGALAQTADQNGLKFVAKSVGTGLNGNSVVITKNAAQTDKVKVDGLNITVNNDATVSNIIAAVLTADVNYEAQKGDTTGSIADSASYQFNGGKAVVEGQLTVKLNNAVTKVVDGKVIIAGKEYPATANNSNTIVVTTGDADVVGEQLVGKVEYKGKEQAISVQIAK